MLEYLAFFLVFVVVSSLWYYWKRPKNLPPGPLGLPFIGCATYMKQNATIQILEDWRKHYGNVFSFYMADTPIVVLADLDVIKDALIKQSDIFSERPTLGLRNLGLATGGRVQKSNLGNVSSNDRF